MKILFKKYRLLCIEKNIPKSVYLLSSKSLQISWAMFEKYTDQQIMEDIRAGGRAREDVWRHITENWGGYCCGTAIKRARCDEHEAREAFSIACIGVNNRIQTTTGYDFLATASLKTYLTSATIRAAWLVMRRRKNDSGDEENNRHSEGGEDLNNWFRQKDCREILEKALANIGERCKKILVLFNDGFGMKEIMKEMNFGTEDVAKTEKWQCQERFKVYLRTNPHIKDLLKENCYG